MSMAFAATTPRPRADRWAHGRAALATAATALALLGLPLLSGCPARSDGAGAQGEAGEVAASDAALMRELERLERIGRARPRDYGQSLVALQARTKPASVERAELLSLRGWLAALERERSLVEQVTQELAAWPPGPTAPAARLALAHVQGQFHRAQGDVREAKKALAVIDEETMRKAPVREMLRCRTILSMVQLDAGEFDASIANGLLALRLAEQLGQGWRRAHALNDLSLVYYRAEQTERARQTQAQAVKEAERDPDPMLMNQVLTVRGILYSDDHDTSITLRAYTEALDYTVQAGADSLRALGLGNFSDYHLRQGKFARALQLAEEALPLARKERNLNAEIVARHNMGLAKISLGRIAEGRTDVRAAITLDEQQGATSYAADGWQELGQYLERAGDLAGAIAANHEYRRLIDQVLRDETRKAVLDAQEGFDAEQRAKEIELLNRDNSLKAEQIRARDLEIELWAALAGCIVLSAVLMGVAYQRIRKTNQALATSNEKLKIQSERDPLTGLANRRHFQAAIKELDDEGGLSGTVFLIDIDHFKRINDVHGHAAGDSVLIAVANRLRAALREDDLVVRWGGEEFLIVVKAREPAYAQGLAQRLLDLLAAPAITHGSQQIPVTASIGFASFPVAPHGLKLTWERAIDLVDTVMYMAKAHGRNKAYGIEQVDAADEVQMADIASRMEASWHEGKVRLVALSGPAAQPSGQTDEVRA